MTQFIDIMSKQFGFRFFWTSLLHFFVQLIGLFEEWKAFPAIIFAKFIRF